MAHRPNSACHWSLYNRWAKNDADEHLHQFANGKHYIWTPTIKNVTSSRPPWKNFFLFISRLVLQKTVLNYYYYILHFISKNFVDICILPCISFYLISSILPLSSQSPKYLLSYLLQKKKCVDLCYKVLCLKGICIISNKYSHCSEAKVAVNYLFAFPPSYIKSVCLYF